MWLELFIIRINEEVTFYSDSENINFDADLCDFVL